MQTPRVTSVSTDEKISAPSPQQKHDADWQFLSKKLLIVGQSHIAGLKSARERIDRFRKTHFICHGCLLPCFDYAIPVITAPYLDPTTGKHTVSGIGHFAYPCVNRFLSDRMNLYPVQRSSMMENFVAQEYGATEEDLLLLKNGRPPTRDELSCFCWTPQWEQEVKSQGKDPTRIYAINGDYNNPPSWSNGWKDGIEFHEFFGIKLSAPDPKRVRIEEENQTIIVESTTADHSILKLTAANLESWIPQFTINTQHKRREFALALQEKAIKRREALNKARVLKGQEPILIAPDAPPVNPNPVLPVDVIVRQLASSLTGV